MRAEQKQTPLEKVGIMPGRMISPSKSAYVLDNPSHLVIWNSVITNQKGEILVSGADLDLTNDTPLLLLAAAEMKENLCVFYEQINNKKSLFEQINKGAPIVIGEEFEHNLLFYTGDDSKKFLEERYNFSNVSPRMFFNNALDIAEQNRKNKENRYGKYFDSVPDGFSFDYLQLLFWMKAEDASWKVESQRPRIQNVVDKLIDLSQRRQKKIRFPQK